LDEIVPAFALTPSLITQKALYLKRAGISNLYLSI